MADRWTRLAELAVHGANIQPGQIVVGHGAVGQEELARAVAAAAYERGAKFVDVATSTRWVKRARIENADPETLEFVPPWYGDRLLALGEEHGAPRHARRAVARTRSTGSTPRWSAGHAAAR